MGTYDGFGPFNIKDTDNVLVEVHPNGSIHFVFIEEEAAAGLAQEFEHAHFFVATLIPHGKVDITWPT